jgi:hypothetical protein
LPKEIFTSPKQLKTSLFCSYAGLTPTITTITSSSKIFFISLGIDGWDIKYSLNFAVMKCTTIENYEFGGFGNYFEMC